MTAIITFIPGNVSAAGVTDSPATALSLHYSFRSDQLLWGAREAPPLKHNGCGGDADKGTDQSRGERQTRHSAALHTPVSSDALLCWNGSLLWNTMLGAAFERPDIGLCEHGYCIVVSKCAPDSNFSFAVKRNNTELIDAASWAQHDITLVRHSCCNRVKHTARIVSISCNCSMCGINIFICTLVWPCA